MGWWTWGTKSISECIMARMYLPAVIAISMALNHSGHMPNEGLQSSMLSHDKRFIYTSVDDILKSAALFYLTSGSKMEEPVSPDASDFRGLYA